MAGFPHHHNQCSLQSSLSSYTTLTNRLLLDGTPEDGDPQVTGTLRCLNRAFGNHLRRPWTEHKMTLPLQKPHPNSVSSGRKMESSQKTTCVPCRASPPTRTAASAGTGNQTSPSPCSATSKKSPSTNRTSRASRWKT